MRSASLLAQAKINVFLRVLGREVSGYHSLETLFQRLELGDEVRVRVEVDGRALDCRGADVGLVEQNLAWRAALAYSAMAGWPDGFEIELEKRIPAGGGLGGGSADAGAVLRLLDHLSPRPLGEPALLELAVALGADVPFLTATASRALAWGRGERLLALPPLPPAHVTLLLPGVGVATADAFRWLAADREADPGTWRAPRPRQLSLDELADWGHLARLAGNDLEGPVAARVPAVARLRALRAANGGTGVAGESGGGIYQMTGSGSTWFALGAATGALEGGVEPPAGVRTVRTMTAASVVEPVRLE